MAATHRMRNKPHSLATWASAPEECPLHLATGRSSGTPRPAEGPAQDTSWVLPWTPEKPTLCHRKDGSYRPLCHQGWLG